MTCGTNSIPCAPVNVNGYFQGDLTKIGPNRMTGDSQTDYRMHEDVRCIQQRQRMNVPPPCEPCRHNPPGGGGGVPPGCRVLPGGRG